MDMSSGGLLLGGLGLDGLDLAGLGVLHLAVLAGLQDRDLVGVDFDAALPLAAFGAVGVVLQVADDAEEGALGDDILLGVTAAGTDEDVDEVRVTALGAILLGVGVVGSEGETHLAGLFALLVDVSNVADDFHVVVVVLLLSHNSFVLVVNDFFC